MKCPDCKGKGKIVKRESFGFTIEICSKCHGKGEFFNPSKRNKKSNQKKEKV